MGYHINIFKKLILTLILTINFCFGQTVIRGPYLQQSTETSIIIHWRTDSLTTSKLWYGNSISNLNDSITDTVKTKEHILKIINLNSLTKYFYTIGNTTQQFILPNTNLFFYTHPPIGSKEQYRFWVVGDAGRGTNNQRIVRDAFNFYNNGKKLDAWLWLGDNAYFFGLDTEYQVNVFSNNLYENVMKHLVAWAAPGNHDYGQNPNNLNPAYLNIFDFPTNAEAGGLASGTEKYFSWNYGNVHFVQLDTYGSIRADTGAMATWLIADLSQNTSTWTIVYFHHPPYTKGSHDSDNGFGADPELPEVRSDLVPIFENFGVDLVLSGHSHAYERSMLIDGHYNHSSTFDSTMIIDSTGGNYPQSCAYVKDTTNGNTHNGTLYVVAGTSGTYDNVQNDWPHPIMHNSIKLELGSMLLEVHENKLQAKFINGFAIARDSFTIVKNMKQIKTIFTCKDSALTIYPTWHEKANWLPMGVFADSITIYPTTDTLIIATDSTTCLKDTFQIKLIADSICGLVFIKENNIQFDSNFDFSVFPNPTNNLSIVDIIVQTKTPTKEIQISLLEINGKKINERKLKIENPYLIKEKLNLTGVKAGLYFVEVNCNGESKTKKIIVQ